MTKKIEFFGIEIYLCENVYEPSEDTELLAKTILEHCNVKNKTVLEIGTGTGAIAILLAKNGAKVTATDITTEAIKCAQKNAKINNVKIEFLKGNLFDPVKNRKFDIIIFNPPYLPEEEYDYLLPPTYKKALIGGKEGNETIIQFINQLPNHMHNHSKAYIVTSTLSKPKQILKHIKNNKLKAKTITKQKYFFEEIQIIEITPQTQ